MKKFNLVDVIIAFFIIFFFLLGCTLSGIEDNISYRIIIGGIGFGVLFIVLVSFVSIKVISKKHKKDSCNTINNFSSKVLDGFEGIDFGGLGTAYKNVIKVEHIYEELNEKSGANYNEEQAINYARKILNTWKDRIEKHKKYFTNYFLFMMILEARCSDNKFWVGYEKNETFNNEKCRSMFDEVATQEFEDSLKEYVEIDTNIEIENLLKEKFEFFDCEKFLASIKFEYITLTDENELSVQLSDNNCSAFVCAYEEFDENLNGLEWHNF